MAAIPLRYYPAKVLRIVAAPVKATRAAEYRQLFYGMVQTMADANGIGLAAPQVGTLKRVIVVSTSDGPLGLLNPEITDASARRDSGEEGCLSIPGVFGLVKRAHQVKIKALSVDGEPLDFSASGLFARVLQHEIDHLNGILFIDRMQKLTSGADRLRELWRTGSIF